MLNITLTDNDYKQLELQTHCCKNTILKVVKGYQSVKRCTQIIVLQAILDWLSEYRDETIETKVKNLRDVIGDYEFDWKQLEEIASICGISIIGLKNIIENKVFSLTSQYFALNICLEYIEGAIKDQDLIIQNLTHKINNFYNEN